MRHFAKAWRISSGIATGSFIFLVSFALTRLFLLSATDAAPRLASEWGGTITIAGLTASGLLSVTAAWFVGRSTTTTTLFRRMAMSGAALGVAATLSGFLLLAMPTRAPVGHEIIAAGDAAATSIAVMVIEAGAALAATSTLVILGTILWAWRESDASQR
jgi:hypothetical protein